MADIVLKGLDKIYLKRIAEVHTRLLGGGSPSS